METVLLQITDNAAYKRLEEMETARIIKVLNKKLGVRRKKLSEKYAGSLPADVAENMQKELVRIS